MLSDTVRNLGSPQSAVLIHLILSHYFLISVKAQYLADMYIFLSFLSKPVLCNTHTCMFLFKIFPCNFMSYLLFKFSSNTTSLLTPFLITHFGRDTSFDTLKEDKTSSSSTLVTYNLIFNYLYA